MQSLPVSMSLVAAVHLELQLRLPANDARCDGATVSVLPSVGRKSLADLADNWLTDDYVLGGYAGI